jgi:hypothetical protein
MSSRVQGASVAARAGASVAALASAIVLAGCGGAGAGSDASARLAAPTTSPTSCAASVLATLRGVARRIYHEGVVSERTVLAQRVIGASHALSLAVERDDAAGARAVAQELVASGHMVSLTILRGGQVLARAGSATALAPLQGPITGASGTSIGRFIASVWGDQGLIEETTGVTGAETVIRRGAETVLGKFKLPATKLPASGTLALGGTEYAYTSLPASEFPSGAHLRIYLVRAIAATGALCGKNVEDTTVNTLAKAARQLYLGEGGSRAQVQVRRVQQYAPLLRAVAARDPAATRTAIDALLTEHIVRLRVSAGGTVIDVGGPYVLAPVTASLSSAGRTIGHFVLSIQDDEGYLRLARRLVGLYVLMYTGPKLVKNSLGPLPGEVPEEGRFTYRGRAFRTITVHAASFPSGPLRIIVLVPIPYG